MKATVKINKTLTKAKAKKVLDMVDKGLWKGMGVPIPGKMCIESAVCFAMGLPHGDQPPCVSPIIRKLAICLNDADWSSNAARAQGMRRLAIAQLGTADAIDDREFAKKVVTISIQKMVPRALLNAAGIHPDKKHKQVLEKAAQECERNPGKETADAANDVARDVANDPDTRAYYAARAAAKAAGIAVSAAAYAVANTANVCYGANDALSLAVGYAAEVANAVPNTAAKDPELAFFAEEVVQVLIGMKAQGAQWLNLTEAA